MPNTEVIDPNEPARLAADAALREGAALFGAGRWEEARRAFGQTTRFNPDSLAHYNLGVVFGTLGHSDDAIKAYRQAIRIAPAMSEALINLGVELFNRDRRSEALAALQQAVRAAPTVRRRITTSRDGLTVHSRSRPPEPDRAMRNHQGARRFLDSGS